MPSIRVHSRPFAVSVSSVAGRRAVSIGGFSPWLLLGGFESQFSPLRLSADLRVFCVKIFLPPFFCLPLSVAARCAVICAAFHSVHFAVTVGAFQYFKCGHLP